MKQLREGERMASRKRTWREVERGVEGGAGGGL